jgi:hypothetical protein
MRVGGGGGGAAAAAARRGGGSRDAAAVRECDGVSSPVGRYSTTQHDFG